MNIIRKILERDRFCMERVGIELLEVKPGYAMAKMAIEPDHWNGLGTVQGGAVFTLADFALAAAANSHGTAAVSINASINYFLAVSEGTLFAEAVEESFHTKLATYSVRVTNQESELIALMQATVYRKREQLKLEE